MLLAVLERLVKQCLLYLVEQLGYHGGQILKLDDGLFTIVAANQNALAVLDITRTDLETEREALHLVLGKLPTGAVVGDVDLSANTSLLKHLVQLGCLVDNARLVCCNRDNNQLEGSDLRRQYQTLVVAVGHDDRTDQTSGYAPRSLIHVLEGVVLVGELHVECACKAVTEVMRRTGLQCLAVVHHCLDGVGILCTCETLLVGLLTLEHRDCQVILAERCVDAQHTHGLLARFLLGCMDGVTLLPPELTRTQERTGGLLPADNRAPLVVQLRQVTPGTDDLGVVLAEQGLGGRTDAQTLLELLRTAVGNPGALGCEALDVVSFLEQQGFRDKDGHCHVLVTGLLEHAVQSLLDVLPQSLCVGAHDDAALDRRVIDHFRLLDDVGIPLGEIHVHRRDFRYQFLLICHLCNHLFCLFRWVCSRAQNSLLHKNHS